MERCPWAKSDLAIQYHDEEWCVPCHDERRFFEMLVLEGAQAGLSWETILRKRAAYRLAYDNFDPNLVALYGDTKVASLLADAGIVRNRAKVASSIINAQKFLLVQEEFGSFDAYLWGFVDSKQIVNSWSTMAEMQATSPLSDKLSKDLAKRGFKFVGSTICYSYLQAVGLINDHLTSCPWRGAA